MAKNDKTKNKQTTQDPREAVEELGQQIYETLSKGFNEAFGFLQELSSTVEQRMEEAFGTAKAKAKPANEDVVETTAKKSTAAKKKSSDSKKASTKKDAAKKKSTDSKKSTAKTKKAAPAEKKATAKKAAAKKAPVKKAAAKKAPAKKTTAKKAPAKKTAASPTRGELYVQAQKLDIPGRSNMTKAQLQKAITKASK